MIFCQFLSKVSSCMFNCGVMLNTHWIASSSNLLTSLNTSETCFLALDAADDGWTWSSFWKFTMRWSEALLWWSVVVGEASDQVPLTAHPPCHGPPESLENTWDTLIRGDPGMMIRVLISNLCPASQCARQTWQSCWMHCLPNLTNWLFEFYKKNYSEPALWSVTRELVTS